MPVLENLFSSLLSPPPPPPFLSALPTSALFFGLTTCIQEQDTKSAAHVPNLTYRAVLKQIMLKKKKILLPTWLWDFRQNPITGCLLKIWQMCPPTPRASRNLWQEPPGFWEALACFRQGSPRMFPLILTGPAFLAHLTSLTPVGAAFKTPVTINVWTEELQVKTCS